ncbi:uncharacterized protein LOC141664523 [Apium graveolens]|uniref:uncharacterized protein LOC141664523 n=1 Tax=Apium graveolens TaxID=4045 RepID=UPI003D7AE490
METVKRKYGLVGLIYPMLTKSNYTAWALKMKVYMQAHGIWAAVEPINTKEPIEDKTDKMVLVAIYQGIPEDVLLSLADKKTAKEAWDAVKMMCLGADRFGDLETMTIEEAVGSLKAHEECLRGKSETSKGDVVSGIKNSGAGASHDGGRSVQDRSEIKSFNYNIYGHYAAEFRRPKRERRRDVKAEAHLTQAQGDDEPALLLVEHKVKERNQLSKFKTLDDGVTGLVRFGDGSTVSIKGKGTVGFQCKNGEQLTFHDVYFILDLCNNIISLGQLSENGNKVIQKEDYLWIYDGQESGSSWSSPEDFESHEAPDTTQASNVSTRSSHGIPGMPQVSSASTGSNTIDFQPSVGSGSTQSATRESNTQ